MIERSRTKKITGIINNILSENQVKNSPAAGDINKNNKKWGIYSKGVCSPG
jgi:hypothetical protein